MKKCNKCDSLWWIHCEFWSFNDERHLRSDVTVWIWKISRIMRIVHNKICSKFTATVFWKKKRQNFRFCTLEEIRLLLAEWSLIDPSALLQSARHLNQNFNASQSLFFYWFLWLISAYTKCPNMPRLYDLYKMSKCAETVRSMCTVVDRPTGNWNMLFGKFMFAIPGKCSAIRQNVQICSSRQYLWLVCAEQSLTWHVVC